MFVLRSNPCTTKIHVPRTKSPLIGPIYLYLLIKERCPRITMVLLYWAHVPMKAKSLSFVHFNITPSKSDQEPKHVFKKALVIRKTTDRDTSQIDMRRRQHSIPSSLRGCLFFYDLSNNPTKPFIIWCRQIRSNCVSELYSKILSYL